MANIQVPQNPGFPDVYQWELNDDVIGGPEGTATRPIRQLTERTANVNKRVAEIETLIESGEIGGGGTHKNYGNVPFLFASDKRELSLIDGGELDVESLLDTGNLVNGKDYYLFECSSPNGEKSYKVSLTKSAPQGMNPEDVELIGGFHTLCVDVGAGLTYSEGEEVKTHPLIGYVAGDILPASVWCLNHRPYSEPEGMVYIKSLDFWCDIYLQSGSGEYTKSEYQGAITRNRQYVDFVEDQFCVRKQLLDDAEFAAAMLGSNEQTSVAGASEAGATTNGAGGRVDTANRRMISVYGVEEGCGSLWQWLNSTGGGGAVGSAHIGSGWQAMTTSAYGPYAQNGGKGSFWGLAIALLAGGAWSSAAGCGSRARNASYARSYSYANCGGRGRSRPMRSIG